MYGNLILHVAVRADGSIEHVRVLRSSGFEVLDEAAVKIVELAAPFAPFPPDIRAETDVLDITRTWQFLSNNRLGWETELSRLLTALATVRPGRILCPCLSRRLSPTTS